MKRIAVLVFSLALLSVVGIFVVRILHRPTIPANIASEASFVLFYPKGDPGFSVERSTFKFDPKLQQLSFVVSFKHSELTFSEQTTPETFYVSADYYNKLISNMGGYYTFQNSIGKVNLAKDSKIGHEVGVMNSKGTLLFINSLNPLSNTDWREVFNSLVYQQGR